MKNNKCESIKKTKWQFANQFCFLLVCVIVICSCSQSFSKINSVEFVQENYNVILANEKSVISKPSITVAYNKYYNEAALPADFVNKYRTDTISYKKQMAIECFLGNQNKFKNIDIGQILENKSEIKIYFEATKNDDENSFYQPFLIAKMHKTRKNVSFYLNSEDLETSLKDVYVK